MSDGDPAQFVEDYYTLLPGDTRSADERLSPTYRQRTNYGSCRGFWATISGVTVTDVVEPGADTVDATVTYTNAEGVTSETRRIYLEPATDGYAIASDERLGG